MTKRYDGAAVDAVHDVSLAVEPGQVIALLGVNGAGKSTTIKMITTQLPLTSGEIVVNGVSVAEQPVVARAGIGVAGQSSTLDGSCTVEENLYLHCRYFGMRRREAQERASRLLGDFGLEAEASRMPATLSGGQAKRLQLARSVAHEPPLLLLDEPTNDLDVPGRASFWDRVHWLRRTRNTAVLFATHALEEAEEHCDEVVVIDKGEVVLQGRPDELRRTFRGSMTVDLTLAAVPEGAVVEKLAAVPGVVRAELEDRTVHCLLEGDTVPLEALAPATSGVEVIDMATRRPSLREVFLHALEGPAAPAPEVAS